MELDAEPSPFFAKNGTEFVRIPFYDSLFPSWLEGFDLSSYLEGIKRERENRIFIIVVIFMMIYTTSNNFDLI